MKICLECSNNLSLDDFRKSSKTWDGYQHFCRKCTKERERLDPKIRYEQYKKRKKEEIGHCRKNKICIRCYNFNETGHDICNECANKNKVKRKSYIKNGICPCCKDKINTKVSFCLECLIKRREYQKENRNRRKEENKKSDLKLKYDVFSAYGGYKCNCCGNAIKQFLTIDHVNNNGAEHRRKVTKGSGIHTYRWLRKNNYPKGFQVLCFNCNSGKQKNGGVCPHKTMTKIYSSLDDVIEQKNHNFINYAKDFDGLVEEIKVYSLDEYSKKGN